MSPQATRTNECPEKMSARSVQQTICTAIKWKNDLCLIIVYIYKYIFPHILEI